MPSVQCAQCKRLVASNDCYTFGCAYCLEGTPMAEKTPDEKADTFQEALSDLVEKVEAYLDRKAPTKFERVMLEASVTRAKTVLRKKRESKYDNII